MKKGENHVSHITPYKTKKKQKVRRKLDNIQQWKVSPLQQKYNKYNNTEQDIQLSRVHH